MRRPHVCFALLADPPHRSTSLNLPSIASLQGADWEAFQAAARSIDDVAFVQTTEKVVADEAAIKGSAPAVVLLKDEEEKHLQYGEGSNFPAILGAFRILSKVYVTASAAIKKTTDEIATLLAKSSIY